MCGVWCVYRSQKRSDENDERHQHRDTVIKIDKVLGITEGYNTDVPLNIKMFKRIIMMEPETVGPVIASERNCREKYKTFCELGIVNDTGRINVDLFTKILKNEGIM